MNKRIIQEATHIGIFNTLQRAGYKTMFAKDCPRNESGQWMLPDNVAVSDYSDNDKKYNLPPAIYIHVHGDVKLGREMNKCLKKAGYTTLILKARAHYIVFMVENDYKKIFEITNCVLVSHNGYFTHLKVPNTMLEKYPDMDLGKTTANGVMKIKLPLDHDSYASSDDILKENSTFKVSVAGIARLKKMQADKEKRLDQMREDFNVDGILAKLKNK